MILPAQWQETFTLSQGRIIGDVNTKGSSTFRKSDNKEVTNLARLELAYGWTKNYQSGVSLKYQNKSREFNGSSANDSGWNDIGLIHAYRPKSLDRLWIFQTLNIPTSTSVYDSRSTMAVDAHGVGTYISSVGVFGIHNVKEWDFTYSSEIHHSFKRTFKDKEQSTEVGNFWGGSVSGGVGYIPWRSKARYGLGLSPRIEGSKTMVTSEGRAVSKDSLVWDTSINFTYTFNAEFAMGVNYVDQTVFGPARNTLLNRSLSVLLQSRWL